MEIEREKEEKWRERGKERSFTHSSYPSFFHPCLLADVCVCVGQAEKQGVMFSVKDGEVHRGQLVLR